MLITKQIIMIQLKLKKKKIKLLVGMYLLRRRKKRLFFIIIIYYSGLVDFVRKHSMKRINSNYMALMKNTVSLP